MNTNFKIDRVTDFKDLDSLSRVFDLYRQFYKQASDITAGKVFLRERLERKESVVFAARDSEKPENIIGFVQLYPSFSSVSLKPTWILNDLYVESEYRQAGIGEALIQKAVEYARELGAQHISLATAKDNPAQVLYQRLGWVKNTTFDHYKYIL